MNTLKRTSKLIIAGLLASLLGLIFMALTAIRVTDTNLGNIYQFAFGSDKYKQLGFVAIVFWTEILGFVILAISVFVNESQLTGIKAQLVVGLGAGCLLFAAIWCFFMRVNFCDEAAQYNPSYTAEEYKSICSLGAGPILLGILNVLIGAYYVTYVGREMVKENNALLYNFDDSAGSGFDNYDSTSDSSTDNQPVSPSSEYSSSNPSGQPENEITSAPAPTPAPTPENEEMDQEKVISLLREYKKLLDEGILTQEEFEQKKKELLRHE